MAFDLKAATPDTSLNANAYLFGADSQSSANPSLYQVSTLRTLLLGGSSDTQVMFNNNGAFGGLSQLTYANSMINVVSAPFGLSGNISAAAWTTNGIRYKNTAATMTDTSSTGTVATAYTDVFGGNTIAASNATTFTDYITGWFSAPTAGTNVTITNRWALGVGGNLKLGADASGTNQAGTNITIGGSRGTGTGAGGSIIFQVAPAGATGAAKNALATALTIDSTKLATFAGSVVCGNSQSFYDPNSFAVMGAARGDGGINICSSGQISFCDNASARFGTVDVLLRRDAANTLALRNGANAQKLSIYNTYTSGTSYERYDIDWITTANTVLVGPTKGSGGGTQRTQRLQYLEDGGSGSTTPSLGTTCPAASATVKSWIKVITSDGTTAYVPCWA